MSENPFSILDFLGYFFPGATVLIALYHYVSVVNNMFAIEDDASIMIYVVCIIAAYVLGHIVALLSSLTVEKYVNWKYSYPSKYLLKGYSRGRYFREGPMNNPSIGEKAKKQYLRRKGILKAVVLIVLAPISFTDWLLSRLLGIDYYFTRRLPDQQISMVRAKSTNLYKRLNIYSPNQSVFQDDTHRIIHNYYYEKANGHSKRMENCIAVYDYLRAMSFVFVVLFYVTLVKGIRSIDFSSSVDWSCVFFIASYACLSYICYMGFMKFYRKFTVENFMCLICDGELDIHSNSQTDNNPTTGYSVKQGDEILTVNK